MNLNKEFVEKLRIMRTTGASVAEMLEAIKLAHKEEPQIRMLCMKYLMAAFDLPLANVLAVPGWCGFKGGELTDEQIEAEVDFEIK